MAKFRKKPVIALAEGGIVTKPTMALIGEHRLGAILPLQRGGEWDKASSVIVVNIADYGLQFRRILSR